MRIALSVATLCVAASLSIPTQADANAKRSRALLHDKVKHFSCSVSISSKTEAVKQRSSSRESFKCNYSCYEDFSLVCRDEAAACPKLVSAHFNTKRYDLSGTGKGTAIGLDVRSQIDGGIDRRSGVVKYTTGERHTFQGDPIFIKSAVAKGFCRPVAGAAPVRKRRQAAPPALKRRRYHSWEA